MDPATGLIKDQKRDDATSIGRFIEQDPSLFYGGYPNLYIDSGNDQTNLTDPSGLNPYGGNAGQQYQQRPTVPGFSGGTPGSWLGGHAGSGLQQQQWQASPNVQPGASPGPVSVPEGFADPSTESDINFLSTYDFDKRVDKFLEEARITVQKGPMGSIADNPNEYFKGVWEGLTHDFRAIGEWASKMMEDRKYPGTGDGRFSSKGPPGLHPLEVTNLPLYYLAYERYADDPGKIIDDVKSIPGTMNKLVTGLRGLTVDMFNKLFLGKNPTEFQKLPVTSQVVYRLVGTLIVETGIAVAQKSRDPKFIGKIQRVQGRRSHSSRPLQPETPRAACRPGPWRGWKERDVARVVIRGQRSSRSDASSIALRIASESIWLMATLRLVRR